MRTKLLFPVLFLFLTSICFGETKRIAAVSQMKGEQNYKVTFVELGSVNCVPCKMMRVVMDQIEARYSNQVKVVFYDVWTEQGKPFGRLYKIRVIPTQVFLDKNGKEYYRHEGFFPKADLVKVLEKQGVK